MFLKSVFQRYSSIFHRFIKSAKLAQHYSHYHKTPTRSLFSMLLKPRNIIFFPALKLSMLHETEKRSLFMKADTPLKLKELIRYADDLYKEGEKEKLMALLMKYQDSDDAEVLWRLARVLCEKATSDEDDRMRKGLMLKAVQVSQRAVDKDPSNYSCHKWHAIVLERLGEFQGMEEKRSQAFEIRDHLLKAIELNGEDPMLFHSMGLWCFEHAEISWFERSFSSILSTSPPQSSFQEALEYFMKAEKLQFGLSSANYLMIAKTHLKLKNKPKAKKYLLKTMNFLSKSTEDKKIFDEAVELMKANKLDEI